jgi:hypothetical protein
MKLQGRQSLERNRAAAHLPIRLRSPGYGMIPATFILMICAEAGKNSILDSIVF